MTIGCCLLAINAAFGQASADAQKVAQIEKQIAAIRKEQFDQPRAALAQALELKEQAQALQLPQQAASAQLLMSALYNDHGLWQLAIAQTQTALEFDSANRLPDTLIADLKTQLGRAYYLGERHQEALQQLDNATKINLYTARDRSRARCYELSGRVLLRLGKPHAAMEKLMRAKQLLQKTNDTLGLVLSMSAMTQTYLALGETSLAHAEAQRAYLLSQNLPPEHQAEPRYLMAQIPKISPAKRLSYWKEYILIRDSVDRYQKGLKLYELDSGSHEKIASNPETEPKNNQVLLWIFLIIIIILFLVFLFISIKKQNKYKNIIHKNKNEIEYLQRDIQEQEEKIRQLRQQKNIDEQKFRQFLKIKTELENENQTLKSAASNLEEIVASRTWELLASNQDLKNAFDEVDLFAYRASHDFKGPLKTLEALVAFAKVDCRNLQAEEYFEAIIQTVKRMDKFLDKLLLVHDVKNHTEIISLISTNHIIEYLNTYLSARLSVKNIAFDVRLRGECEDQKVNTDWELLKISLSEAIDNSIAFMRKDQTKLNINICLEKQAEKSVLLIEDNGQGIHPSVIGRVKEMFFRGNECSEGNGLGLFIIQKAMEKTNSELVLHSEHGKSTTVELHLGKP